MKHWALAWAFGAATVRPEAGMLWSCEFILPSGRRFRPFARAPWADSNRPMQEQPAHMRYLGGEFTCVPFGIGGEPRDLLPEWRSAAWKHVNPLPHGRSADLSWDLVQADRARVSLRLDYPPDDDIDFLTRRVSVDHHAPALDLELTLHARRSARVPVGLHPILRLPELPAQLELQAAFEVGVTYPAYVPPGVSRVAPGARFWQLEAIPGRGPGTEDYSRLPKTTPTEELLMLCNVRGPVRVRYPAEKAVLQITWDTRILPSCLLWPSDSALLDPPWNGEFRGLGVEPIAAVFDAAREVAVGENPLNEFGVATAVDIAPGQPCAIRYRIEAYDE